MPPAGAAKAQAALKAKEAKQKKLLIALAPVLLLLLAWQGPKTVKAFTGGESAPAPTQATTTSATPPTGTADPTAAAPSTAAGATPEGEASAAALPETDVQLPADPGQLITFDRFVGKDPFRQQLAARDGAGGSAGTGGGGGTSFGTGSSGGSGGTGSSSGGSGGSTGNPTGATIDVNGEREPVAVGASFPAGDPIFRLVSVTRRTAQIGLVTGSFSTGSDTVSVNVGDSVTLVSQPDGVRYVITIVSVA